jgi:GTPase
MWEETRIGIIGSVDSGKCFGKNTPVRMSDGTIKWIQDIVRGDYVIGEDHITPKKVNLVSFGYSDLYNVQQSNGMDYKVNGHHILSLYHLNEKKIIDIDILEYIHLSAELKEVLKGFRVKSDILSDICVEKLIDKGEYYGFSLEKGYATNRFLLADNTIVHNSTLTGVLVKHTLDNGRGSARTSVLRHHHERETGRTSCLVQHYSRNDDNSKVTILVDLAGHEKYLKTTISGMSKCFLDYSCVVIAANMGVLRMTKEHLSITLGMNIPFFIVLTKVDISPPNITKQTIRDIKALFKTRIVSEDSLEISETRIPLIKVSSVTGENIDTLRHFISHMKPFLTFKKDVSMVHFIIESVYIIKGIGFVVSGILKSGTISTGDSLLIGPFFGRYYNVQIKSIHNNFRETIDTLHYSNSGCINFKFKGKNTVKRSMIRKGVKLISSPILYREFKASVKILHHHTSIHKGYKPFIHCNNISQSCKIIGMDKEILRLHEKAIVHFRFEYYPEFIEIGDKIIFREGRTKGVGEIIEFL